MLKNIRNKEDRENNGDGGDKIVLFLFRLMF